MTENTPLPGEDAAQLRRLAVRLIAPAFDSQARQPQLLVGSLPEALPYEVPLPAVCELIGSFVRNPEEIQVLFDVEQSAAEVIAFYTQQMQARGWSEPEVMRRNRRREGGFTHTYQGQATYVTFCKSSHGPALGVSTVQGEDGGAKTEVRLHIDGRTRNTACGQSSEIFMEVGHQIPPLEPPPGGRHWGQGGGSDSERASTAATLDLEEDMPLPQLAAHYARQLEQAGWQRTGEGSSGPMAWNTWEFRDKENEPWWGVFGLLVVPGMVRKYYLHMIINWVGDRTS